MTHCESIIEAFEVLDGEGRNKEIHNLIEEKYPDSWKDTGTALADMVPEFIGGNTSFRVRDDFPTFPCTMFE